MEKEKKKRRNHSRFSRIRIRLYRSDKKKIDGKSVKSTKTERKITNSVPRDFSNVPPFEWSFVPRRGEKFLYRRSFADENEFSWNFVVYANCVVYDE